MTRPAPSDDHAELRAEIAADINRDWRRAIGSILAVAGKLNFAKDRLPEGEFHTMIEADLPFGIRTAQRLMAINRSEFIKHHATHASCLPASWMTLYELTRLGDEKCQEMLEAGEISGDLQRKDITALLKAEKRRQKHSQLVEASELARSEIGCTLYAVGVFDPPWRTVTYSEKGLDRAVDNHYPTMTIKEIKDLDLGRMFLDDAVLFLWATMPLLDQQIEVLQDMGFRYVSHWVWTKPGFMGNGYWGREAHEILLIGRRGSKLGPPETVPRSVWDLPYQGNSVKPPEIYQFIADQYEGLALVEGFARVPKDPRFDVWGNEAGREAVDG